MEYAAYLFDFDYTLVDSSRGITACFRTILERHGFGHVTDEAIKRTIGHTLEKSFTILTGIDDPGTLAAFKQEYAKEADKRMTSSTIPFPETVQVLTALKAAGVRTGIISTKYRYRIEELLAVYFPENPVDIIIGGEDVTEHKPSPQGLLLALDRLHLAPAQALYIGDSTVDAQAAQAAGLPFAGVLHGVTTAEELGQYPHVRIMTDLSELLGRNTF